MTLDDPEKVRNHTERSLQFMDIMKGNRVNDLPPELPDCIKVLVNECHSLGEIFMKNTLNRFSKNDFHGGRILMTNDVMMALNMFGYNCRTVDSNELRWWVFNNNLIVDKVPECYNQDGIYIDVDKLVTAL